MIRINFLYLFLTHFIIPIKEEWAAYCETFDEYQETWHNLMKKQQLHVEPFN